MVTAKPKGQYLVADYFSTPEGERWELIDGVLYHMAAAPSVKHQIASGNLTGLFRPHIVQRRLGLLLYAPCAVILPGESAVDPDLLFVSSERRDIITTRACEGPPDFIAEILSPSNSAHDMAIKRELYARHAVPEYWIIDPIQETVLKLTEPFIRQGLGAYFAEATYGATDPVSSDSVAGLTVTVADVFVEPW